MLKREDEGIEKLRQVVEFATDDDCEAWLIYSYLVSLTNLIGLAHNLAKYFGDEDAVPNGMCQRCTFCTSGQSTEFKGRIANPINPAQIHAILQACPERDDPRLLARMAFGITSPRLTDNRWSTSHPLFGSMVDADFRNLVQIFDEECKKTGYERSEAVATPVSTTKKRTYISSTSGSNCGTGRGRGGNYSRGGGSKRTRRY
jgi:hypothetical protein